MKLRVYLREVVSNLDEFLAQAGRQNATVVALRNTISSAAGGDDRALDVEDPRMLSRGFDDETGTIPNPDDPAGERVKIAPTTAERAEAAAKADEEREAAEKAEAAKNPTPEPVAAGPNDGAAPAAEAAPAEAKPTA